LSGKDLGIFKNNLILTRKWKTLFPLLNFQI